MTMCISDVSEYHVTLIHCEEKYTAPLGIFYKNSLQGTAEATWWVVP